MIRKFIFLLAFSAISLVATAQDKVGVNTNTPGSTLSVNGNGAIGATYSGQAAPSNGVIIEGNTGIGTASPSEKLEVVGNVKVSSLAGTGIRMVVANASGVMSTQAMGSYTLNDAYNFGGAGAGRTITASSGAVLVNGTDGFQNTGTFGSGATLALSGAGTRMFFYPQKAAFRAGYVDGTQWDNANIGIYSTATGYNTTASVLSATAMGQNTIASGNQSTAMGYATIASGHQSLATGANATASGMRSTAMGNTTTAQSFSETAIGAFNTLATTPNATTWVATDRLFTIGNGPAPGSLSNALIMLKNGNTTLNGALTLTNGTSSFTLPQADGTANQVLTTNGSGAVSWVSPIIGSTLNSSYNFGGAGAGRTITANSGAVLVAGNDGFQVTGAIGGGATLALSGGGTKMFFYPQKAAFRAGHVTGTQWNNDSIGNYSTAFGYETKAIGSQSTAMGYGATARGNQSTAMGINTIASGVYAIAMGHTSIASGESSTATGYLTKANGNQSTAMGFNTIASGHQSTATGYGTTASGVFATAMGNTSTAGGASALATGQGTSASGNASTAMGFNTQALGNQSTAMGYGTTASGNQSTAIGINTTASGVYAIAMGHTSIASGESSTATGYTTQALGNQSTAMGYGAIASGHQSTAMGINTTASGVFATAMGNTSTAGGTSALATGQGTSASGAQSTAMGFNTIASGNQSTAIGYSTTASGVYATAMGHTSIASAELATAMGYLTTASANNSTAMGLGTKAQSFSETTIGAFNTLATSPNTTTWVATDRLFTVGNGTGTGALSDAMVILKNGNIGIGTSTPSEKLQVVGNILASGTVTASCGTLVCSDIRYKKDILPLQNSLEAIAKMRGVSYNFRKEEFPTLMFNDKKQVGFIAQELETVYPELVNTDEKGYKSVDYAKVTPILVEAIKELNAKNEDLTLKAEKAEANFNELKAQVEKLNNATFGNSSK